MLQPAASVCVCVCTCAFAQVYTFALRPLPAALAAGGSIAEEQQQQGDAGPQHVSGWELQLVMELCEEVGKRPRVVVSIQKAQESLVLHFHCFFFYIIGHIQAGSVLLLLFILIMNVFADHLLLGEHEDADTSQCGDVAAAAPLVPSMTACTRLSRDSSHCHSH